MRKILAANEYVLKNLSFSLIEEKIDGICFLWTGEKLLSAKRMLDRSDRFSHLVKVLREIFPNKEIYGEIAVENGTVYDIMKVENWEKACFFPFMVKGTDNINSRKILESIDYPPNIILPRKFRSLEEGIEYVRKYNKEGLVLKNEMTMFKYKIKREAKCRIVDIVKNTAKYSFVVDFHGNPAKIPCRDNNMARTYFDLRKKTNDVFCEFEYVGMTNDGKPVQPVARGLFIV